MERISIENKPYERFSFVDYKILLNKFSYMSDSKYRDFTAKLEPGAVTRIRYGICLPELRKIAKFLIKGDWKSFLSLVQDTSYEEVMLTAMVLSGAPMSFEERKSRIDQFLPKVNSWSICDTLTNDLKDCRKHYRKEYFYYAVSFIHSKKEFDVRFATGLLLWHFHDDTYTVPSLQCISEITHEGYYARMGAAWAISQFYIYQRNLTLPLIQSKILPVWTQNKAIQKIRESFRVDKTDKDMLLKYKK